MIYDEMQKVASEILSEFDQGGVYYIALVPGNGPADDPGPPQTVPFKINTVVRGVKSKYVQNGLAIASDLQCVMSVHPDVTPDIHGRVRIDQGSKRGEYKVVQAMPIPPAGVTVAHRLIFRK